jgi:ATP-binding cassette, subfamily C (CFTR/MRP), member 4
MLKDKTVILVTHQIHITVHCDRVMVLEDGCMKSIGKFNEIEEDLKSLAAGAL